MNERGYWAEHQDGQRYWHEAPERERCGGSGTIHCYCGGDFCCCGNFGDIDCLGCEDCEHNDDDYCDWCGSAWQYCECDGPVSAPPETP